MKQFPPCAQIFPIVWGLTKVGRITGRKCDQPLVTYIIGSSVISAFRLVFASFMAVGTCTTPNRRISSVRVPLAAPFDFRSLARCRAGAHADPSVG